MFFCQVLVVFIDNKSGSSLADVQSAAKSLEDAGIIVIPIAIGGQVDVKELKKLTPDKENILEPPDTSKPGDLSKKIMEKIQTGSKIKLTYLYLFKT